jgi:hypothetical protein
MRKQSIQWYKLLSRDITHIWALPKKISAVGGFPAGGAYDFPLGLSTFPIERIYPRSSALHSTTQYICFLLFKSY